MSCKFESFSVYDVILSRETKTKTIILMFFFFLVV